MIHQDNPLKRSSKLQLLLISLIPCGFTAGGELIFASLHISVELITAWFLFAVWIWAGRKGYALLGRYLPALVSFNWLGFLCLGFAFAFYHAVPMDYHMNLSFTLFPYGLTDYPIGDFWAGLFSRSFVIFADGLPLPTGNPGIDLVLLNTLFALVLFSIGYLSAFLAARKAALAELKSMISGES